MKADSLFLFLRRNAFLLPQRNPWSFLETERGWERAQTHSQNFNSSYRPAQPLKNTKSHTLTWSCSNFLAPRAAETVKRISHGFPATQYGHKRDSAQLWLAETKGRGQTVGHQSHIHKRWKPWITEYCRKPYDWYKTAWTYSATSENIHS